MADVANTCPLEPTDSTTMEATTTIRSETFKWFICYIRHWNTRAAASRSVAFLNADGSYKAYTEDVGRNTDATVNTSELIFQNNNLNRL